MEHSMAFQQRFYWVWVLSDHKLDFLTQTKQSNNVTTFFNLVIKNKAIKKQLLNEIIHNKVTTFLSLVIQNKATK